MLKHGIDYCNNWWCVCVQVRKERRKSSSGSLEKNTAVTEPRPPTRPHWQFSTLDCPLLSGCWCATLGSCNYQQPETTIHRRGATEETRNSGFVIRCNSSSNRRFCLVCFFFRRRRTSWSLKECRDLLRIFRTPQGHSGRKADCLYHQVKHRPDIVIFVQFPWNVQVENCTLVGSPEFPADTVPGGLFRPIPVKLALSECRRTLTTRCVFFFYMKFDETDLI